MWCRELMGCFNRVSMPWLFPILHFQWTKFTQLSTKRDMGFNLLLPFHFTVSRKKKKKTLKSSTNEVLFYVTHIYAFLKPLQCFGQGDIVLCDKFLNRFQSLYTSIPQYLLWTEALPLHMKRQISTVIPWTPQWCASISRHLAEPWAISSWVLVHHQHCHLDSRRFVPDQVWDAENHWVRLAGGTSS